MARYLALECSATSVRLVVAASTGGRAKIQHTATIEAAAEHDSSADRFASLGRAIAEKLAAWKIATRRLHTVVVLPRSMVEWRVMNMPPVGEEPLAEAVQELAPRELGLGGDESVIDFTALAEAADETRFVEVAAITAERLEGLKTLCDAAGLTPSKVVLKAHATASLARRCADPAESIYMLARRFDRRGGAACRCRWEGCLLARRASAGNGRAREARRAVALGDPSHGDGGPESAAWRSGRGALSRPARVRIPTALRSRSPANCFLATLWKLRRRVAPRPTSRKKASTNMRLCWAPSPTRSIASSLRSIFCIRNVPPQSVRIVVPG